MAKMLVMISCPAHTIERPHSDNSCGRCSECYPAMNCIVLILNRVLCGQSSQSILVYNFTNMFAMSYKSDFFARSCTVNIEELAVCLTVSSLLPVSRVGSTSVLILTAMSDSQSLNISYSGLWSLPKMNMSSFVIWATLHCKSFSMLGGT
jgi:hypothetical protein